MKARLASGSAPWPVLLRALPVLLLLPAAARASTPGGRDSSGSAPVEMRLPADTVYRHAVAADSAVIFSHQTHVAAAGNRCTGCHPAVFRMLSKDPAPSHRMMDAGLSCGLCHNGRQSFGVRDAASCGACHSGAGSPRVAGAGAPTGRRGPGPHTFPRSEVSPGTVTFRHETHLKGVTGCPACHPRPFAMAAAPPRPGGGMHEKAACGACHDGRKAFATDDSGACARCHVEGGGTP